MNSFNFVDKLLEITYRVESPTSYLEWASYVTLGAILRHNVYIDFPDRGTKVTPSMYVLLVGDSGATRKSTPLKIANRLLKRVNNTKLIEGRASIQAVLRELADTRRTEYGMLKYAGGIMYSEEFAAMLVKDPSASGILTDIYDYHEAYDVILKGEGTVKLEKVSVCLFSATNAIFLQDMFTKTDIYGGLVGRTIIIIEEKARCKDLGLGSKIDIAEDRWEPLVEHLRYLARLEGPIRFAPEAENHMNNWYRESDFSKNESKTGFEHRMHTHVLKLAVILAAAEPAFDLHVSLDHCIKAIDIITRLRSNYHKLINKAYVGMNPVVKAMKDITSTLMQQPDRSFKRSELMQALDGEIDADNFDKAIISLDQMGYVKQGGIMVPEYTLSAAGKEKLLAGIYKHRNGKGS